MLNQVQLIGFLGKDPEIRRTTAGKPVATLRVATSETWKDKATGERKEQTEWHTVVVFNEALAGVAERFLRKGSKLYLQGALRTRKWTHNDGGDRYSTEIVLSGFNGQITLLDKAERQAPDEGNYGTQRTRDDAQNPGSAGGGAGAGGRGNYALDDDIPF